ncbi:MAG: DoxX family membrane protein [Candidatus Heimdallarchaeota archaeon]|nr:DoxX family membrane protein [Candidatus Heimdallarchaeota archaeon]
MNINFIKESWKNRDTVLWLILLRLIIGIEWFMAGLEKIISGTFVEGMYNTLNVFIYGTPFPESPWIVQNPNQWYVTLTRAIFRPNSELFGYLVMIGEFAIGITLILGLLVNFSAIVSVFLNINFLFAAGWLSPSTLSVNWILALLGMIVILSPGAKTLSIDKLVVDRIPRLRRFLIDWFGFEKKKT